MHDTMLPGVEIPKHTTLQQLSLKPKLLKFKECQKINSEGQVQFDYIWDVQGNVSGYFFRLPGWIFRHSLVRSAEPSSGIIFFIYYVNIHAYQFIQGRNKSGCWVRVHRAVGTKSNGFLF